MFQSCRDFHEISLRHYHVTWSSLKGISLRHPHSLASQSLPTSRTDFQTPKSQGCCPLLLFLSLLKNLNKLPPYVSEGAPWERSQDEYTADGTQTLTSSNIASSVPWCSPYAHLAPADICWQHSNISPARPFIFLCRMLCSISDEEVDGGYSRFAGWKLALLDAITNDVTCQRVEEGSCLHDKVTNRCNVSIKCKCL